MNCSVKHERVIPHLPEVTHIKKKITGDVQIHIPLAGTTPHWSHCWWLTPESEVSVGAVYLRGGK